VFQFGVSPLHLPGLTPTPTSLHQPARCRSGSAEHTRTTY
jgi:hypothetical protein